MRGEGEIRQRLKQVLFRHRKKLMDRNFKRRAFTCVHNTSMLIDGVEVGVCGFEGDDGPTGTLCDARVRASTVAQDCPSWAPHRTAEEVKDQFQDFIETGLRGEVALEYPDVVALQWVLGEDTVFPLEPDEDAPVTPEPTWLDKLRRRK